MSEENVLGISKILTSWYMKL